MISQEANANANSSNTQKLQKYQIWGNDVKLNIGGYFQNLKEVLFSGAQRGKLYLLTLYFTKHIFRDDKSKGNCCNSSRRSSSVR